MIQMLKADSVALPVAPAMNTETDNVAQDSSLSLPSTRPPLRLFVGTWNMGAAAPPSQQSFADWIPPNEFDLYVIGVQECYYKTDFAGTHPNVGSSQERELPTALLEMQDKHTRLSSGALRELLIGFLARSDQYYEDEAEGDTVFYEILTGFSEYMGRTVLPDELTCGDLEKLFATFLESGLACIYDSESSEYVESYDYCLARFSEILYRRVPHVLARAIVDSNEMVVSGSPSLSSRTPLGERASSDSDYEIVSAIEPDRHASTGEEDSVGNTPGTPNTRASGLLSKLRLSRRNDSKKLSVPQTTGSKKGHERQFVRELVQAVNFRAEDFFGLINTHLGDAYTIVCTSSLWAMRLLVLVRKDLQHQLYGLQRKKVPTGPAGAGNKGAVGVSFSLGQTSFCFVNSHLAAHQDRLTQRDRDYRDIVRGMRMGLRDFDLDVQFDYTFWLGDLNYRLDLPRETVLDAIAAGDLELLKPADQLSNAIARGNAFVDFKEAPLTFPPTYQYEVGSSVLAPSTTTRTRSYNAEKQRIPSWCDRILWHQMECEGVGPVSALRYGSATSFLTSDHAPVYGHFLVPLRLPRFSPSNWQGINNAQNWVIRITKLECQNLRAADSSREGLSPYVLFHGSFLHELVCTPLSRGSNPRWNQDNIVPIKPLVGDEQYLRTQYLLVAVLNGYEQDDNLGQVVLPLALGMKSEPGDFRLLLKKSGVHVGLISGTIFVTVETNGSSGGRSSTPLNS